ncbi:MAG: four-helix bundle copper-binding protein [Verrucomicrobia bacterium]|nr:MAG: four-helix bundle copper-binding protein [Verrucomicrobiota bacterium]
MPHTSKKDNSEFPHIHNELMDILQKCMITCIACSKKCIDEGHKVTAALCGECGYICNLTVLAISREFETKSQIIKLCGIICKRCWEECKKMDVPHCQECAKICEDCFEECYSI